MSEKAADPTCRSEFLCGMKRKVKGRCVEERGMEEFLTYCCDENAFASPVNKVVSTDTAYLYDHSQLYSIEDNTPFLRSIFCILMGGVVILAASKHCPNCRKC